MNLKNKNLLKTNAYIDGTWVKGGKTFDVVNPANGKRVASVSDMRASETNKSIEAAQKAFPAWRDMSAEKRSIILRQWADLMVSNQNDLAMIMTTEQGKPLSASKGEIIYAADFLYWFAEEGRRAYGETIPSPIEGARIVTVKQPVGVCAAITPWNFPSAMITRKAGAALAAGCTVVCKPAEDTPLSALALAVLAEEAGVPPGVLNILPTSDAPGIGKILCEDARIKKLSFTGSTEVGKILMKQCAGTLKKLSLELGGNAPFIVFEDADINAAIDGLIACKFRNTGQACVAANRIYIQEKIYDEFAKKFITKVKKLKTGDGREEGVIIGPLINKEAADKVENFIKDAVKKGAKIEAGGKRHKQGDLFFQPTVLTGVKKTMDMSCNEIFGPVAPLYKFKTEDEVLKLSNDTNYGLAAYFYSRDIGRCWRLAEALDYGMVGINVGILSTAVAPFGGVKESGFGREGSKYGLEEYMNIKYLLMAGIA